MTKLLALTDIHIKPVGQTIIGLDPYENFKRALKHAFDHHPDAERVILMGDLTNSGTPEEYARFGEVLKSCDKPITLMCGNHDQRDNLTAAFPWATLDANGFVQDAFVYGNTRVLTIDTQYGPPFVSYAHFGAYCDARFDWLNTQLAAAKAEGWIKSACATTNAWRKPSHLLMSLCIYYAVTCTAPFQAVGTDTALPFSKAPATKHLSPLTTPACRSPLRNPPPTALSSSQTTASSPTPKTSTWQKTTCNPPPRPCPTHNTTPLTFS
jgi:hypothetical protein